MVVQALACGMCLPVLEERDDARISADFAVDLGEAAHTEVVSAVAATAEALDAP